MTGQARVDGWFAAFEQAAETGAELTDRYRERRPSVAEPDALERRFIEETILQAAFLNNRPAVKAGMEQLTRWERLALRRAMDLIDAVRVEVLTADYAEEARQARLRGEEGDHGE